MKKVLVVLFILLGLTSSAFAGNFLPAQKGVVTSIEYSEIDNLSGGKNFETKQDVTIKILTGQFRDSEISLDNMLTGNPVFDMFLSVGDKVILHQEAVAENVEDINDVNFYIADIERTNALYLLVGIFFALLLIIGKKKGIYSFVSILATVALIFFVLTPMLLSGASPIWAALFVCILSTLITVYLVAGFNYKSTSAVLGTVLSLILAAILSNFTIRFATLTGFTGDESMFLYTARPDLDFMGLLSASIMLAALGAVMDVGVSIASTINEIHETDSSLSIKDLFASGMNVGRDIIGTMSNTLILVYLGSALPLVLLSSNIDLVKFFNLNHVATEIASALIGSIAILACVPITAIVSAYLIKLNKSEEFEFDTDVNLK